MDGGTKKEEALLNGFKNAKNLLYRDLSSERRLEYLYKKSKNEIIYLMGREVDISFIPQVLYTGMSLNRFGAKQKMVVKILLKHILLFYAKNTKIFKKEDTREILKYLMLYNDISFETVTDDIYADYITFLYLNNFYEAIMLIWEENITYYSAYKSTIFSCFNPSDLFKMSEVQIEFLCTHLTYVNLKEVYKAFMYKYFNWDMFYNHKYNIAQVANILATMHDHMGRDFIEWSLRSFIFVR